MTKARQAFCLVLGWLLSILPFHTLSEPASYTEKLSFADFVGSSPFGFVALGSNSEKTIQTELLDRSLIMRIAKAKGILDPQMKTVVFETDKTTGGAYLYQIGSDSHAFYALADILTDYVTRRKEGYSSSLLQQGMTNREPASADCYVTLLSQERPFLPVSALRRSSFYVTTNEAGVVVDSVSYTLTDNGLEWNYMMNFHEDGTLGFVWDRRGDAKEHDPKFRKAIQEVEDEVEQTMKADGTKGRFGSVHHFWQLKKARLEQRGIIWRSPAELNPSINYD